jgi:hypothetical protein
MNPGIESNIQYLLSQIDEAISLLTFGKFTKGDATARISQLTDAIREELKKEAE